MRQTWVVPDSGMIGRRSRVRTGLSHRRFCVVLCHASCIVEARSEAREVQGDVCMIGSVPRRGAVPRILMKNRLRNQKGHGTDISQGSGKGQRRWERVGISRNGAFRKGGSRKSCDMWKGLRQNVTGKADEVPVERRRSY
jgi:hypothetical protein